MSDYKRLVSYIYSYPGNVKEKNVGFAKAEVRGGQFKLDITLQGVYTDAPCIFSIYLLTRSDKYFKTIYLGNTVVNSGRGKYKDILNPSNINNSGYAFKDICGIATTKNNDDFYRMYSLWDDETFLPENVIYKQSKENTPIKKTTQTDTNTKTTSKQNNSIDTTNKNSLDKNITITNLNTSPNEIKDIADTPSQHTPINSKAIDNNTTVNNSNNFNTPNISINKTNQTTTNHNITQLDNNSTKSTQAPIINNKPTISENISDNNINNNTTESISNSNVDSTNNTDKVNTKIIETTTPDNTHLENENNDINTNNSYDTISDISSTEVANTADETDIHVAEAPAYNIELKKRFSNNGFEKFFKNADFIDAFDNDYYYDCIEVSPEQLKAMPIQDKSIANNSFLIHGFYNFRHLLFGKVQENTNGTHYFIGVPGMYCNRERFMASMYGFGNFKKSHRSDYSNPYFGYWYQEI